MFIWTFLITKT